MDIDLQGRRLLSIPRSMLIAELWNGGLTARLGLVKTITTDVQAPARKQKIQQRLKVSGRWRRLDSEVAAKPYKSKLVPKERSFEADMKSRVTQVDDERAELSSLGEDIKVCLLNIRGLKADKVKYIAWYVCMHSIDVLSLQDAQPTVQTANCRKAELKQELEKIVTSVALHVRKVNYTPTSEVK
jgi:hypothetical protein